MKKILTLDGMEISISYRGEDFLISRKQYSLQVDIQVGVVVTVQNRNKIGTYQLTLEQSIDPVVYSVVQDVSVNQFIDLIIAELAKDPVDRYDGEGWSKLFNYLDGNVDQVIDA